MSRNWDFPSLCFLCSQLNFFSPCLPQESSSSAISVYSLPRFSSSSLHFHRILAPTSRHSLPITAVATPSFITLIFPLVGRIFPLRVISKPFSQLYSAPALAKNRRLEGLPELGEIHVCVPFGDL